MIKKIYEVDPLICPECSRPMRNIAFIEEEEAMRKILEHLKLWEEPQPQPPADPWWRGLSFVVMVSARMSRQTPTVGTSVT
jgi:hypothetical protein